MEESNKPQHELVTLEPIEMNAPVEVSVKIYAHNPALNKVCGIDFRLQAGVIPTKAEIQAMVDACLDDDNLEASGLPKGSRVLTKPEFVALITKREAGRAIPMPGNQSFVPSTIEIPRHIIIHALFGVGVPSGTTEHREYVDERKIARQVDYGDRVEIEWCNDALTAMPTEILLALYMEICDGN